MLQPCFAAMFDGAVMARNPPSGLSAVPQDGTNASPAINAILGALPHANTNTRNIFFTRPSTRYQINGRLDMVSGAQVLCGGIAKIALQNASSNSHSSTTPWFRGADLQPAVRMENVQHCRWHGGGWEGRANASGVGGTVFEMATARFCHVSDLFVTFVAEVAQMCGMASGSWTEFCSIQDTHARDNASSNATRRPVRVGTISYRTASGKARNCAFHNLWASGFQQGPQFDEALDCIGAYGYQEFHGGGSGYGYEWLAGCSRVITYSGHEGVTSAVNSASGSSGVVLGAFGGIDGTGDFYSYHKNS
jgi:hypothetical protein